MAGVHGGGGTDAMPAVTVVVPTRNRRAFLEEAVASVLAQGQESWELVVVDDASEDDTWAWLRGLSDERVRSLRLECLSERSVARNRGLAEVRSEFVLFLDDDDRLLPDALAQLVAAVAEHPDAVAAVGARRRFGPGDSGVRIGHPQRRSKRVVWPELLAGWSAVPGQCLFRTALVRGVGGFPARLPTEDRELWLSLATLGPAVLCPAVVLEYRAHVGQWRPSQIVQLREEVSHEFIGRLPPERRGEARRIRAAGRRWHEAEIAREGGSHGTALILYARAALASPRLLRSPIVWPALYHGSADALRGLFFVRR